MEQARLARVRRRPLDEGTAYLLGRLHSVGGSDGWIEPDDILKLGTYVSSFNSNLEKHLVKEGWYREPPTRTSGRWAALGVVAFVLADRLDHRGGQPAVLGLRADRRLADHLGRLAVHHLDASCRRGRRRAP